MEQRRGWGHSWWRVWPSPRPGGGAKARQLRVWCWAAPPGPLLFLQSTPQGALGPALPGKKLIQDPSAGGDLVPPTCLVPNLAYDIQKLYDKDPLGNVLIDKKRLEKILLLSYVCNTQAGTLQGRASVQPPPLHFFLESLPHLSPGSPVLTVPTPTPEYQQGFHEMVMLFQLMAEHDHETFWLFQFFLQKTVRAGPELRDHLPATPQTPPGG